MGLVSRDDGWWIPDWLWERMEPPLPPPPPHLLGCLRPRVPDRAAMNAILLVLGTGVQWNALNATGVCSSSAAHRRIQEWAAAGYSTSSGARASLPTTSSTGIDWEWLALDGAMAKAPLRGEDTGPNPTDRAKGGRGRVERLGFVPQSARSRRRRGGAGRDGSWAPSPTGCRWRA